MDFLLFAKNIEINNIFIALTMRLNKPKLINHEKVYLYKEGR